MSASENIPQTGKRLSIQVDLNGLSFAIIDTQTNSCLDWRSLSYTIPHGDMNEWAKEVDRIFTQELVLSKSYDSCSVYLNTTKYTLIPTSLFLPEQAHVVLNQLFPLDDLEEVNHLSLPAFMATGLFAGPGPLSATIIKHQRNARFFATFVPLLYYLKAQPHFSKGLIHYSPTHIHLILMQGERLLLCNAYAIDKFTTGLYFLFNALNQWQMNPHSLSLYLSGPFKTAHLKQLTTYFPSLTVATASDFLFPTEALNLQFAPLLFPVCE